MISNFKLNFKIPGQKDIKSINQQRKDTTRARSARVVYSNLLLRYLTDFFGETFFKKCRFRDARLSPFGGGGKISTEARRHFTFLEVFKILDSLSLHYLETEFSFEKIKKPMISFEKIN